ncbi:hypothetical protein ACLOJK_024390 [Asimina triloba]
MVSKRQSLARKRFREENPHPFPQQPNQNHDNNNLRKKNKSKKISKETDAAGKKKKLLRKHPLRLPGMKPGEGCFICKAADHIAKLCPKKSLWEKDKVLLETLGVEGYACIVGNVVTALKTAQIKAMPMDKNTAITVEKLDIPFPTALSLSKMDGQSLALKTLAPGVYNIKTASFEQGQRLLPQGM